MMKKICLLTAVLLAASAAHAAEDYDGRKPLACAPLSGHDCLPTEKTCKPLQPEAGRDVNLYFDVQKMQVKTPYRNAELPIQSFSNNTKSLVMQGTSLEFAWSATIHRTTGRLAIAIVDREGSYVIFGQCKVKA
jgi:hypothetical protein